MIGGEMFNLCVTNSFWDLSQNETVTAQAEQMKKRPCGFVKHGTFLECTSHSASRGVTLDRN
jgi:hypothetical protein